MTNTDAIRVERRASHRFTQYQVPVLLRALDGATGTGFTLDLSCRGVLVRTDFPLTLGQMLEISLVIPSEITLAEDMSVCCRGRVLRMQHEHEGRKPTVAVKIEHYEFLPQQVRVQPYLAHPIHRVRP